MAVAASSALAGALLAFAATAVAAPVPGTPDPVAPGVPGYGRAWELVTPPDVTPARAIGYPLILGISPSGDRLLYNVSSALQDATYGSIFSVVLAVRGPGGWLNTSIPYPEPKTMGFLEIVLRSEGAVAVDPEAENALWANELPAPEVGRELYASGADGAYTPLVNMGTGGFKFASEDLRRLFFDSSSHLLPADAPRLEGFSAYEYFDGTLRLVDVKDDGTLLSNCGSTLNGISTDGERAFFTAQPECGPTTPTQVFLRAEGHTTEISASQCDLPDPECGPEQEASFVGATPSGSVAYISTAQRLTDDDSNSYRDLYRYDVASGKLTLLTPRSAASTASPGSFIVDPSSDGSRVYLAAVGQLIPGEGAAEGTNLYLADSQGLHFIAPLSEESQGFKTSPDGRYVVFTTSAQLAPEDSDEGVDIYRYDVVTGQYTELSAGLDGSPNGAFTARVVDRHDIDQRVFFTTDEPLVPQDHNELEDVYEWTEAGGLCLVSAGTPGFKAEYVGGTPDGRTILIRTGATLLPSDRDGGEVDIYAARVGGGFPEPAGQAGCGEGGGCEAPSAGTPHRTLPTAATGKPFIGLAPIDAVARRQLVDRGSTTLLLEVPGTGRLTAQGKARIGSHEQVAAIGGAVAKKAGPVRLRLQLTEAARGSLAHGGDLRVRLVLRMRAQKATRTTSFALGGTR
jgi:hypothetical protein